MREVRRGLLQHLRPVAERDDLDFVLHLGDYIYEVSNKPPAPQTVGPDIGRPYVPDNECVSLEDYRARYGHYHQDPDLMAMHHAHSVIGDRRRSRVRGQRLARGLPRAP